MKDYSRIIIPAAILFLAGWSLAQDGDRFVPGNGRFVGTATVELCREAGVAGNEVRLKDICRWPSQDAPVLAPIGELVVTRMKDSMSKQLIRLSEIKSLLSDAKVNLAGINFTGATTCSVSRNETDLLIENPNIEYLNPKQIQNPKSEIQNNVNPEPVCTLKDLLTADLADRLNLPIDTLQINFDSQYEKILNFPVSAAKFQIEPGRCRNLGNVSWNVSMGMPGQPLKKMNISAVARAWQEQVVLTKPLAFHQVIQEGDITQKRALVDRLETDGLLKREQIVGQQAGRELKPGTVMAAPLVEAVPMARPGQLISITVQQGLVQIQSVARAMDAGSYGQTIRVKNEATKDVFEVTLTGPQTAVMGPVRKAPESIVLGNGNRM